MVYLPRNTENPSSEDQNKGLMIHHCGESGKVTFTFTCCEANYAKASAYNITSIGLCLD